MDKARADGKKIVYIGFGSIGSFPSPPLAFSLLQSRTDLAYPYHAVVSDPEAMTACVVQSVLESDVRVILSKGWSDRLQSKKDSSEEGSEEETPEEKVEKEKRKIAKEKEMFPDEVFPIASVPHDWLFPRIDAACHHGGGESESEAKRRVEAEADLRCACLSPAGTTGASLRGEIAFNASRLPSSR
jgi:sterol 3beta-glucosyltransferase